MAKKNNTPETLEDAIKLIAELEAKIAQQDADLKEKDGLIADIRATKGSLEKPSFTHKGKKYLVLVKSFSFNKQVITAEQVCKSKDIQAQLIEAGVGFIKPE